MQVSDGGTESRSRKTILVIEDDADAQELYGRLLWYNNYEVDFANTGAEGVRLATTTRPDLVLLDLRLPDGSGTAVHAALRSDERTARIPIVVLTALSPEEYADWASTSGCAAFLQKPIEPVEVFSTVERIIGPPPAPLPESAD